MSTPRNIRLLSWHAFFLDLRFFAAIYVILFAQVSGSYALALSVLSITMVAAGLLELPTGLLSDRIGRKPLIVAGALFSVLATSLYAAAPSFAVLALGGVAEGVQRACFSGNNEALLYETLAQRAANASWRTTWAVSARGARARWPLAHCWAVP